MVIFQLVLRGFSHISVKLCCIKKQHCNIELARYVGERERSSLMYSRPNDTYCTNMLKNAARLATCNMSLAGTLRYIKITLYTCLFEDGIELVCFTQKKVGTIRRDIPCGRVATAFYLGIKLLEECFLIHRNSFI